MTGWSRFVSEILLAALSLVIGLSLGGLLAYTAGESPWRVIEIIVTGAFGSGYDRGMVIYFAGILIATGLAVALPFQVGVFNIGGEGQTLMGALAAGIIGAYAPTSWPHWAAVSAAFVGAVLAAGFWGSIAGGIRAFRGGHEVIGSIMLNFIAAGITGWLVVGKLQAPDSQNPEMKVIGEVFKLHRFEAYDGAPATTAAVVALIMAILFWLLLEKTPAGLRIKTVRQSPDAAVVAGYDPAKVRFWAFTAGAAMCGLAGAVMVLGESWRFRLEISDGFGFLGIPVALLGRGRPLGVVVSAILFAVLHHGASSLDIESTKVGRDLAQVIEAVVVLSVISLPSIVRGLRKWI